MDDARGLPDRIPSTLAVCMDHASVGNAMGTGQPSVGNGRSPGFPSAPSPSQSLVGGSVRGDAQGISVVDGVGAEPASPSQVSRGSVCAPTTRRSKRRQHEPAGPDPKFSKTSD